jgi:hypothetical protein
MEEEPCLYNTAYLEQATVWKKNPVVLNELSV